MTVEVALVVSILSVAFSVYYNIHNSKRSDISEIERKAKETAEINAKLDMVLRSLGDMQKDSATLRKDVVDLHDRVVTTETSLKTYHKRLDTIENRLNVPKHIVED